MKFRSLSLFIMLVLVSMFVFAGCPKKTEVTTMPEPQQEETAPAPAADDDAARRAAEEEAARARAEQEARDRAAAEAKALQPVYFDFDQSIIRDDARAIMKANAEWLKANPGVKVKIEGNCDERGTIEYNQALGQRRAAAARKYLTDLGISSSRISVISYGKEKPVCNDSSEGCWQQNRRADLVAQ